MVALCAKCCTKSGACFEMSEQPWIGLMNAEECMKMSLTKMYENVSDSTFEQKISSIINNK